MILFSFLVSIYRQLRISTSETHQDWAAAETPAVSLSIYIRIVIREYRFGRVVWLSVWIASYSTQSRYSIYTDIHSINYKVSTELCADICWGIRSL